MGRIERPQITDGWKTCKRWKRREVTERATGPEGEGEGERAEEEEEETEEEEAKGDKVRGREEEEQEEMEPGVEMDVEDGEGTER